MPESRHTGDLDSFRTGLADRYEIERELGRGGMAIVYLATEQRHGRRVAIKVLHPGLTRGIASQRFLREIEIAAQLQHPNILPLHDSGECAGHLYYVMPYVEGETLRDRLDREGRLPMKEAVRLAAELADALSHAHDQGVVHRDVKPENVLLSGGHAVIADFGIARAISVADMDRMTESGHAVGTPAYMSPEQAGGDANVDGRTDIYGLGCLLFEMLVGQPPFTAPSARAVIARHMLEPAPSLRAARPGVPESVVYAVEKALAKAPADRFRTASEFKAAIESDDGSVVRRAWLRSSTRRALTLLLLVAAIIGAWTVWRFVTPASPPLDANKVVVFPLAEGTLEPNDAGAGMDVAMSIYAVLSDIGDLDVHQGWDDLPEGVRRNRSLLTASLAREMSWSVGALFYVDGVVRSDRDSLTVILRVNDAEGDSVVFRETVTGGRNETTWAQAGFRALSRLLSIWLGPNDGSVSPLPGDRDGTENRILKMRNGARGTMASRRS